MTVRPCAAANGGGASRLQSTRLVLPPQCCYGGRVAAVAELGSRRLLCIGTASALTLRQAVAGASERLAADSPDILR